MTNKSYDILYQGHVITVTLDDDRGQYYASVYREDTYLDCTPFRDDEESVIEGAKNIIEQDKESLQLYLQEKGLTNIPK